MSELAPYPNATAKPSFRLSGELLRNGRANYSNSGSSCSRTGRENPQKGEETAKFDSCYLVHITTVKSKLGFFRNFVFRAGSRDPVRAGASKHFGCQTAVGAVPVPGTLPETIIAPGKRNPSSRTAEVIDIRRPCASSGGVIHAIQSKGNIPFPAVIKGQFPAGYALFPLLPAAGSSEQETVSFPWRGGRISFAFPGKRQGAETLCYTLVRAVPRKLQQVYCARWSKYVPSLSSNWKEAGRW